MKLWILALDEGYPFLFDIYVRHSNDYIIGMYVLLTERLVDNFLVYVVFGSIFLQQLLRKTSVVPGL